LSDRVSVKVDGHIADVRLNRPDKMNALDPAMFEGICVVLDRLSAMPGLRAVVLSGEGKAFCAGLDMGSMAQGGSGLDIARRAADGTVVVQRVAWGWRMLPVPVIAAGQGVAFGGGFQIFCGADIRVAHPETRLSIMEAKWGLVPDMAGWPLWRTLVRDDVLRELAYTAREFTAVQGQALGFVTHVDADPRARAFAIAREIAARSPDAVRGMKRLANAAFEATAASLLQQETDEQLRVIRTPNQVEAVMANMERRSARFVD
jgi:enoyl-CoA hydratase/carnithine racemase